MLRRLRIKFILINMLLVTLVLLAVFGTLVYSTASQLERESMTVMALMLRRDGVPPQFEFKAPLPGTEREWQSVIPVFCVAVDDQGEITLESGENVKVSQDVVEQAVEPPMGKTENPAATVRRRVAEQGRPLMYPKRRTKLELEEMAGTAVAVAVGPAVSSTISWSRARAVTALPRKTASIPSRLRPTSTSPCRRSTAGS